MKKEDVKPELFLEKLNLPERRLIAYVACKKNGLGFLFLKNKFNSNRSKALRKLICSGILEVCKIEKKIISFRLTSSYSYLLGKRITSIYSGCFDV